MAGGIFAGLILGPVGVLLRRLYSYSFLVMAIAQAFYAPFDILSDGGFLYAGMLAGVLVLMGVELLRAPGCSSRAAPDPRQPCKTSSVTRPPISTVSGRAHPLLQIVRRATHEPDKAPGPTRWGNHAGLGHGAGSQIAPFEAEETNTAYFASAPVV
jgi:hypothetical protein